jgi:hypothetical protein
LNDRKPREEKGTVATRSRMADERRDGSIEKAEQKRELSIIRINRSLVRK